MIANTDEDRDQGLDPNAVAVVQVMRERLLEPRPPAVRAESLRWLRARVAAAGRGAERAQTRAKKRRLVLVLGMVAAAGVAGAVALVPRARLHELAAGHSGLTYTIDGKAPSPSGYVPPAPATAGQTLSFSDGTRIKMEPEARGRVVELSRRGGRIALEDGRAHVDVVHRAGAKWLFEAGPFLIEVRGTAFSLAWNGREARFELQMERGVVSVTGPVSGGAIVLRDDQRLAIDLRDRAPAPPAGASAPVTADPRPSPEPAEGPVPAPLGRSERGAPEPWGARLQWSTRLQEGRADLIMGDARRLGLAKVLERSSSEDLAALASAARYQHQEALARRALLAQRRRFPGSIRASDAAFLLGRLEDESNASADAALRWYDRYLVEAPEGAYASEALGRKMTTLRRNGQLAEASEIAADYLRRFPTGTYAHAARPLLRSR